MRFTTLVLLLLPFYLCASEAIFGHYPTAELIESKRGNHEGFKLPLSVNTADSPKDYAIRTLSGIRTTTIYNVVPSVEHNAMSVYASFLAGFRSQGFSINFHCFDEYQGGSCGYFFQQELVSERQAKDRFAQFKNFYNLNKAQFGMISVTKDNLSAWIVIAKSVYSANIQYVIDGIEEQEKPLATLTFTEASLQSDIDNEGRARLSGVYFKHNSSELTKESIEAIRILVAYLKSNSNAYLVVGHTDATGDFKRNLKLSEARASVVRDRLIVMGISPKRLTSFGVSYASPVATNKHQDGRAKNRRVELVLD